MKSSEQPIGVFDSGVGGLTVARAIQDKLPYESMLYFGDRARCPYGDRSPMDVLRYSIEIADFLSNKNVKCLIIACNTAGAVALPTLQKMLDIPVLSVIQPGALAAVEATRNGRIGVIGTSVTIASHAYATAIGEIQPSHTVVEHACPTFVPLVEQGLFDGPVVEGKVREALAPLQESGIDTLVLGCTHYPLLSTVIQRVVGDNIRVISSAVATADAVGSMLRTEKLLATDGTMSDYTYFTTGDGTKMRAALANWFGQKVSDEDVVQVAVPIDSVVLNEQSAAVR